MIATSEEINNFWIIWVVIIAICGLIYLFGIRKIDRDLLRYYSAFINRRTQPEAEAGSDTQPVGLNAAAECVGLHYGPQLFDSRSSQFDRPPSYDEIAPSYEPPNYYESQLTR